MLNFNWCIFKFHISLYFLQIVVSPSSKVVLFCFVLISDIVIFKLKISNHFFYIVYFSVEFIFSVFTNVFSLMALNTVVITVLTFLYVNFFTSVILSHQFPLSISWMVYIFLFLFMCSSFGLYPSQCEWYIVNTSDSVMFLRVLIFFSFLKKIRPLSLLNWNLKLFISFTVCSSWNFCLIFIFKPYVGNLESALYMCTLWVNQKLIQCL